MDYLAFLEKNEHCKLDILGLLAKDEKHRVQTKEILDNLSITAYKLNKLCKELIEDLQQIDQCHCQLKLDGSSLVCEDADYSIYQQLQLSYLKQSIRFQIFEYEYLDQQKETRQKFLHDHYLSQSKFYSERAKVEAILEKQALVKAQPANINMHPELIDRIKITNVYYYFFNGIDDPFPELNNQASRFYNFLAMTFGLSMTPSKQLKLRMFFQIQAKRLAARKFMNIRNIVTLEQDERIDLLKEFYLKNVKHSDESDTDSELSYLLLFLRSQHILDSVPVKLSNQVQQYFVRGSQQFGQVLGQTPVIDQTKFMATDQQNIADSLSELTIWLIVFDYFQLTETHSAGQPHVMMSFPALTALGKKLVKAAVKNFDLQLSNGMFSALLKSYVRLLVDHVPSDLIQDNVTICVDFAQNAVPMEYFSKLLTANLGGGVILTDQLSSDVDIYLSDIFVSSIRDIPQVTWLDPLKTSNWEELRQTITEVKQSKLERSLAAS
ncbi:hypothetical protein HC026_11420 [Lactobacillus sp. LC28-10]|uniref:Mga helix-turn-helix domain-containing protein n=1 Tax=Secundilactobacillus angelensis TaxID=2722706 RepID=A0ABX1L2T4_9LACO|nr:hypothetical protein [Secundilactobacillus angelensis]MCH5463037.1 hypothetical protein [Secundilactobacillus angelensis]NLR19503.1 hypothetical protein [Secundilactobacillus angelensis]